MKITKMTYVGIVLVIIGLASVFYLADTSWFLIPSLLTALGGAIVGSSVRKSDQ